MKRAVQGMTSCYTQYLKSSFLFRLYSNNKDDSSDKGFGVSYETRNEQASWSFRLGSCGGNVTTPRGLLTSPSYPNNYLNDVECNYLISLPNGSYINITFEEFDIHCGDTLELWDGSSDDSPKMASFCGNGTVIPPYLLTSQNHLRIRYSLQNLQEIEVERVMQKIFYTYYLFNNKTSHDLNHLIFHTDLHLIIP